MLIKVLLLVLSAIVSVFLGTQTQTIKKNIVENAIAKRANKPVRLC